MPDRTEYATGTPSWVDLQTSDQDAAKRFYGELFGWNYDDMPMPGPGGVYSIARLRDKDVAAIAPLPPQQGAPPHWNSYVTVSRHRRDTARVAGRGRHGVHAAVRRMDAGRMAVVADPTGAMIALWQAKNSIGAGRRQRAGRVRWNELHHARRPKAAAFYAKRVRLGRRARVEAMEYTVFNNDGSIDRRRDESADAGRCRRCGASTSGRRHRRDGREGEDARRDRVRRNRWTSSPAASRC